MELIAPVELKGRPDGYDLLDVRSPGEYADVHAEGAVNLPLDQVTAEAVQAMRRHSGPLYVICRSGARGKAACERLMTAGMDVVNVDGGTQAWENAGLPVVKSNSAMALLGRYARPVAITLMLGCIALAIFVHWAFIAGTVAVWAGMTAMGMCPLMAILFPGKGKACPMRKSAES